MKSYERCNKIRCNLLITALLHLLHLFNNPFLYIYYYSLLRNTTKKKLQKMQLDCYQALTKMEVVTFVFLGSVERWRCSTRKNKIKNFRGTHPAPGLPHGPPSRGPPSPGFLGFSRAGTVAIYLYCDLFTGFFIERALLTH